MRMRIPVELTQVVNWIENSTMCRSSPFSHHFTETSKRQFGFVELKAWIFQNPLIRKRGRQDAILSDSQSLSVSLTSIVSKYLSVLPRILCGKYLELGFYIFLPEHQFPLFVTYQTGSSVADI